MADTRQASDPATGGVKELFERLCRGERLALARFISRIEDQDPLLGEVDDELWRAARSAASWGNE